MKTYDRKKLRKIVTYVIVILYVSMVLGCVFSSVRNYVHTTDTVEPATNTVEVLDDYVPPKVQKVDKVDIQPVEEPKVEYKYTPVTMLYQTSAKTYMDYRAITNKASAQYKLIHSNAITICEDGFLRDSEGFIGVAMGSKFGPIGSRYVCKLDNSKEIKIIKVEAKADQHTVNGFCGYVAYDIIEFVIDTKATWMRQNKWGNGYIFSGNFNNCDMFKGKIVSIDKVDVIEK